MTIEKDSPCKVNLILNVLGKRPDGFHELETVMQPIGIFDHLRFERTGQEIALTCDDPALPTDRSNLVFRAAEAFRQTAGIKEGVRIHLEKKIPLAAGLGGGSGNAATTLLGLNEIFGEPLTPGQLSSLAADLGSDVPFFLQTGPALGTGRGETIKALPPFPALSGAAFVLIQPGFGIATPWAYQQLGRFPEALNGQPGRADKLIAALESRDMPSAARLFYNSLEAPALEKYPLLQLFQDFFRSHGAAGALMSGSGSTTFAVVDSPRAAENLAEKLKAKFGANNWVTVARV
jgi:4-diphosphocytidyl-2-C-methyl-D-erythritol kinase